MSSAALMKRPELRRWRPLAASDRCLGNVRPHRMPRKHSFCAPEQIRCSRGHRSLGISPENEGLATKLSSRQSAGADFAVCGLAAITETSAILVDSECSYVDIDHLKNHVVDEG